MDVHQVDVVASPQTGDWVDKETNERITNKGDALVFVNFVITNTGDPIDLDSNVVEVSGMYTDWEYVNRMPSITDDELFKNMRGNSEAADFNAEDPSDYTLGKNETFAYGTNFRYQQNSDIIFSA